MLLRPLLLLALVAPAALAQGGRTWVIDQAMVSLERGPRKARVAAVSTELHGAVTETKGAIEARVTLPAGSLRTGSAARDASMRTLAGDVVLEGTTASADGNTRLRGTLTFHGVSRRLEAPVSLSHNSGQLWAHTAFNLRLRDFGADLPDEQVAIDVDAGLHPAGTTIASR